MLTIKEFARKFKLNPISITQYLSPHLLPYTIEKDGIRLLDETRAKEILDTIRKVEKDKENNKSEDKQQENKENFKQIDTDKDEQLKRIKILEDSIAIKNKEIQGLKDEIEIYKQENKELQGKLLETMDRVLKITENEQVLVARTQEQQKLLIEASANKGFLSKIFGKKKALPQK